MIVLTAVQVDVRGAMRFRIESDGDGRETSDPVKAAKILFQLGVKSPLQLVEHARQWGSVEILDESCLSDDAPPMGRKADSAAAAAAPETFQRHRRAKPFSTELQNR